MKDTYWAIRRREIAKAGVPVIVEKKAKKSKTAKKAVVLTEADSLADLNDESRPDNPSVEPESNDADVAVEPA